MIKISRTKMIVAAVCVAACLGAVAAEPTLHQVSQAAEAGNYGEAQAMMGQVLRAHPNSARAHFVEAQLLVKQGRLAEAPVELANAERLNPTLSFARQGAVDELKAMLANSRTLRPAKTAMAVPSINSNFLTGTLLPGAAVLGAMIWFFRSRNRNRSAPLASVGAMGPMPAYGAAGVGSVAPAMGGTGVGSMAPAMGGAGAGILGGLATGAAVGAGMIAGEALMHRVMDGGHSGVFDQAANVTDNLDAARASSGYDMGGNDFGVADASSSWDDAGSGSSDDEWG